MLTCLRRSTLLVFVLIATLSILATAVAQNTTPGRANILFTQQDEVQKFELNPPDLEHHNLLWGKGYQTGTAIGKISGTSYVTWTFLVVTPIVDDKATISFDNTVIVTDLDGDQITFRHVGTGLFHFALFDVFTDTFQGSGGTLTGTYQVTGGIGKYASWVGNKFDYRGIATNPPPKVPGGLEPLGNVYAEIYSGKSKD